GPTGCEDGGSACGAARSYRSRHGRTSRAASEAQPHRQAEAQEGPGAQAEDGEGADMTDTPDPKALIAQALELDAKEAPGPCTRQAVDFIAAARSLVPALAQALEAQIAEVERHKRTID